MVFVCVGESGGGDGDGDDGLDCELNEGHGGWKLPEWQRARSMPRKANFQATSQKIQPGISGRLLVKGFLTSHQFLVVMKDGHRI